MRRCLTRATICLGAFTAGCGSDSGTVATGPAESYPEWVGVVSNATQAIPSAATSVAFVSLPSGTLGVGLNASIRNLRTNALATITVANGGFDPVRIGARTGDSLRIVVETLQGPSLLYTAVVPASRRPVIVRTEPASPATTGIPTRSTFLVVFSEPMGQVDAVRLTREGVSVPGDARLIDDDRVRLLFTPNAALEYATLYDFEVGGQTIDLDGESITGPFRLEVSTRQYVPPPILTVKFRVVEYNEGAEWIYAPQLRVTADASGGAAIFRTATIVIPGLGSTGVCWFPERVESGASTEMFGEAYGDWMYALSSLSRATSTDVTAIISYSDDNGDVWSLTVTGSTESGGYPTYGSGGASVKPC